MCVTSAPAIMLGTRTYTKLVSESRHVTGYQNLAKNLSRKPNCMLLHYPGIDLQMVRGPERTKSLMRDMTRNLPELVPTDVFRGGTSRGMSTATFGVAIVEKYGDDYYVVRSSSPEGILDALSQVPEAFRPELTPELTALAAWYGRQFQGYSFVLACFKGEVEPEYPIVVSYIPHDPSILFVPGVDGHDGKLPALGMPMRRDFYVAFAVEGVDLTYKPRYGDILSVQTDWAPQSVTGFRDNRHIGPNQDYKVKVSDLIDPRVVGWDLVDKLVA